MARSGQEAILTLNAGSSSVKFAVFAGEAGRSVPGARDACEGQLLAHGALDGIETAPHLIAHDNTGKTLVDRHWQVESGGDAHAAAIHAMMTWLGEHIGLDNLSAVGHRVVHGGRDFIAPARVDLRVLERLEALIPFAPLHQPVCLASIRAILDGHATLPQVACFDTAFHHTMPDVARRLALPRRYDAAGIRRFGFHGLSYDYLASWLARHRPALAGGRILAAHIGSGASLCALHGGKSVATTMGFSVLDGLVMGTRPGALDPGVLLYMLGQEKLAPGEIENLLYHESGLLGVSGVTSDMRALRERQEEPAVREALALCVQRFVEQAGAMIASMGGLDGIVFTGGVGEHDADFRAECCAPLEWLGVSLDVAANKAHGTTISDAGSRVTVLVIPANEEATILGQVRACLAH